MAKKKRRTRYLCPKCESDMTELVISTCKESVSRPLIVRVFDQESESASPKCVTLQCPKGHWAEYDCPGGRS